MDHEGTRIRIMLQRSALCFPQFYGVVEKPGESNEIWRLVRDIRSHLQDTPLEVLGIVRNITRQSRLEFPMIVKHVLGLRRCLGISVQIREQLLRPREALMGNDEDADL